MNLPRYIATLPEAFAQGGGPAWDACLLFARRSGRTLDVYRLLRAKHDTLQPEKRFHLLQVPERNLEMNGVELWNERKRRLFAARVVEMALHDYLGYYHPTTSIDRTMRESLVAIVADGINVARDRAGGDVITVPNRVYFAMQQVLTNMINDEEGLAARYPAWHALLVQQGRDVYHMMPYYLLTERPYHFDEEVEHQLNTDSMLRFSAADKQQVLGASHQDWLVAIMNEWLTEPPIDPRGHTLGSAAYAMLAEHDNPELYYGHWAQVYSALSMGDEGVENVGELQRTDGPATNRQTQIFYDILFTP